MASQKKKAIIAIAFWAIIIATWYGLFKAAYLGKDLTWATYHWRGFITLALGCFYGSRGWIK